MQGEGYFQVSANTLSIRQVVQGSSRTFQEKSSGDILYLNGTTGPIQTGAWWLLNSLQVDILRRLQLLHIL